MDVKELPEFSRLRGTDGALAGQGFMDMAPLAEDGQESGGCFAGMFEQESEPVRWRGIVRRHGVPTVVILDQQAEQAHEFGFLRRPGAALAEEVSKALSDRLVLLPRLDDLGAGFGQ